MQDGKSFFATLFDFSFSEFLTIKLIKFLFSLGVFFSGIASIIFIVNGFNTSSGLGVVFLIISPLIFLLNVIFFRIWLELIIVIFKIAENTKKIADKG